MEDTREDVDLYTVVINYEEQYCIKTERRPHFSVYGGLCPCSSALHDVVVDCLNISQSHGRPELPRSQCGSTPIRDNERAQFGTGRC